MGVDYKTVESDLPVLYKVMDTACSGVVIVF